MIEMPGERDSAKEYGWIFAVVLGSVLTIPFPLFGFFIVVVASFFLIKLYVSDFVRIATGFMASIKYVIRTRDTISVVLIYVGDFLWTLAKIALLGLAWNLLYHKIKEVLL